MDEPITSQHSLQSQPINILKAALYLSFGFDRFSGKLPQRGGGKTRGARFNFRPFLVCMDLALLNLHEQELTYTLDFVEIRMKDISRDCGKNASLGEMFNSLRPQGIGVVDGFATTAEACRFLLAQGALKYELRSLLKDFDHEDVEELRTRGHAATRVLCAAV